MSFNMPGKSQVHVDRPLTSISVAFQQSADAFVADRAFPVVRVEKQSDLYFTFDRRHFFRDEAKKLAPGTRAAAVNYDIGTDSYACHVWALAHDIADQTRANVDSPLNLDRSGTLLLTQKMMLKKEREWVSAYFTTSKWTGDQTGVDSASPGANQFGRWDRDDSDPIEVIRAGKRTIQGRTGYRPNKLILGRAVYDALLDHPDIIDRIKAGQTPGGPAMASRRDLAALFELDEILVMDAIHDASAEGAASADYQFIGGKHALLVYANPAPALEQPSGGYTFAWSGLMAGSPGTRMLRFRLDPEQADRLQIEMSFAQKLVAADLGIFYNTAVN